MVPAHEGFPIVLRLEGRRAVIVGGGKVAQRKAEALLAAGAAVVVVALEATEPLRVLASRGRIELCERPFDAADVLGATLAFAATADAATNERVRAAAALAGVLVNDARDGDLGDFTLPAVHRSGPLAVAVDTGGVAPAFAKRVRDDLAGTVDSRYAAAAQTLGRMRAYALEVIEPQRRAAVLARLAGGDLDTLATMSPSAAEDAVDAASDALRGAGPGSFSVAPLVCATRGSALAVWQARHVMRLLAERGFPSTLERVTTLADRAPEQPIGALGSDGVFVKELESALRDRRADYAVHSCKDLPSTLASDMRLAAVGARDDPRDAFCSERFGSFADLPAGAVVGTSSPRRVAQLRALRGDLRYEPIRGNVDTRLRKLREGQYDAIVLAMAGLERLGLRARYTVAFAASQVVPAVAQGALAAECRADDDRVAAALREALNDATTERCVRAERAFLRTLRAGCQTPAGAFAQVAGDDLTLDGVVAATDGSRVIRGSRSAAAGTLEEAEGLGEALAGELIAAGAGELLLLEAAAGPLAGKVFLLPRTQERESRIAPALRSAGADVVEARDSDDAVNALAERIPDVLLFPSSGSVEAVEDYLASLQRLRRRPLVAAMGPSSAGAAAGSGFPPDAVSSEPGIAAFVHCVTQLVLEKGHTA